MNAPNALPLQHALHDLERFRLRSFLESLGPDHLERRHDPIDLADVAAVLEGNPRAVWFERPGNGSIPLAGSVCGSRARLAKAFGTTPHELLGEVLTRLKRKGEVMRVERRHAPAQAVVLAGDAADFTTLPVSLQHDLDGAPYISASIDFAVDPATGWTNVGVRRMMLRGRRQAGIDLVAPSDLRALYEAEARAGRPVPVAFVVGSHPIDHVAATMRIPVDEIALIGALRDAPLAVVKCVTNDLYVPADAEFVLEGYLDARGHVEAEGPYGEFLGYYGAVKQNPVFHLTAITHRRDAIFQTVTIGGADMSHTDSAQMVALRTEVTLWRALESAVREVTAVHATTASGGMYNVRIALKQRVPDEARNAIAAAFGCLANVKNVFVVDPDIDIFSDAQMDWALATRFQADRDLVVQSGFRTLPLDPSLDGKQTGAKAGFDLTLPMIRPGEARPMEHRVPTPPRARSDAKRYATLEAALADGPMFFSEIMAALGSRDGRDIVRALEPHYQAGRVERDREGRYRLK